MPSSGAPAVDGPGPSGAHIWIGRTGDEATPGDLALLDPGERRRMERFTDACRRAWYAGAHAAFRRIVGASLGVEPGDVGWGTRRCPGCGSDQHGPPYVRRPDADWEVSMSRCEEWWMLALSKGDPVGVDIERRQGHEAEAVFRRCLTEAEQAHVASYGEDSEARQEALMRCWVRKEAVVKSWGLGLGTDLARVDVRPDRELAVVAHRAPDERTYWVVRDVAAPRGCLAALARPVGAVGPVTVHLSAELLAG
ncbi:4'-phosphopantetheinyl transferase superfamily protein [Streptomyces sp. NPDC021622]|uniref:4'-phosphopantetheinyl transferase family protein n=1 Tax=Streptomyces sp. NPDC021622 TaxID=3155013 RepID=UPI0033E3D145